MRLVLKSILYLVCLRVGGRFECHVNNGIEKREKETTTAKREYIYSIRRCVYLS